MTLNPLILLVNDEEHLAIYLRSAFEEFGFTPTIQLSGSVAELECTCRRLRPWEPAVGLVAKELRHGGGLEALSTLRRWSQACCMPVIFLSHVSRRIDWLPATLAGADEVMDFPATVTEMPTLIGVIATLLVSHLDAVGAGGPR